MSQQRKSTRAVATIQNCEAFSGAFRRYIEGALPPGDAEGMQRHLQGCAACAAKFEAQKQVIGMLGQAYGGRRISEEFDQEADRKLLEKHRRPQRAAREPGGGGREEEEAFLESESEEAAASGWRGQFSAAPWWVVSVVLHGLVIALAGLISMAISLPPGDDAMVTVTELAPRPVATAEPEQPKEKPKDVLSSKFETPPTDPTSKQMCEVTVPPELLAKAELGDHFETINPDRPDTHSAFGNPDAHMFHSEKGSDEPEGGGGNEGLTLEDMIGVGGAASPGTGGGWGGGHGTGIGVGNGSGRGSFGNRNGGGRKLMVMRHGGSAKSEAAVDLALQWLARHQEPDGHWDVCKYEGKIESEAAMTGVALLAFLGAGHTEKIGKYKNNVLAAVKWLKGKQKADGSICRAKDKPGYTQAITAMALAEAAGMSNIKETCEAAQKAIDYCCNIHQMGEGSDKLGWRYEPKTPGDISVSGWYVMALKSAKVAGLHVDPASFEGALKFLSQLENKNFKPDGAYDNGRYRYGYINNTMKQVAERPQRTAIGCLCQIFMGTPKEELLGATQWFMNTPGERGGGLPSKDRLNAYYFYYSTLLLFQMGGDEWKRWNDALMPLLVGLQRRDGDFLGSWDPEKTKGTGAPWGGIWGRVGQTALHCLCLEIYYRYQLLR